MIQLGPRLSTGGKIGVSVFLVVWTLFALLMLGVVVGQAIRTARTFWWEPVACVIVESRLIEPGAESDSYSVAVRYRYSWEGREYRSDRLTLNGRSWSDYRAAQAYAVRYAAGGSATCYVNPAAPSEAVLERQAPWIVLLGLVLLGFAAVGVVGLWSLWRKRPATDKAEAAPISAQRPEGVGLGLLIGFCSVFMLAGVGFFYVMFCRPVTQVLAARHWQETPCEILSSRVRTHHGGGDGPTYSVEVLYSYEVNGVEYKSSRYSFVTGSSSGYESKMAVVERYAPGTRTVCYVNRADPTEAVLVRHFVPEMWFGLLPLVFVAVGLGGLVFAVRRRRQQGDKGRLAGVPGQSGALVSGTAGASRPAGPVVLRSTGRRVGKFAGSVLVAAFWNGLLSVFIVQGVRSFQRGQPEWFLAIFMIPFVIVGVVLVGYAGYSFLSLFAPGVKLRLSAGAVPLGGSAELAWEITGRATAIRKLRLWLEGCEEIIGHQGDSTTERATFATIELAAPTLWTDIRHGQVRFTVPADTMHSFKADHNRITWTLRVRGDIAFYPDVNEEFAFTVLPLPPAPAAVP